MSLSPGLYCFYNNKRQVQLAADVVQPIKPPDAPANWIAPDPTDAKLTCFGQNPDPSVPNVVQPSGFFSISVHPNNPKAYLIRNTATKNLPLRRDITSRIPVLSSAPTTTATQWSNHISIWNRIRYRLPESK